MSDDQILEIDEEKFASDMLKNFNDDTPAKVELTADRQKLSDAMNRASSVDIAGTYPDEVAKTLTAVMDKALCAITDIENFSEEATEAYEALMSRKNDEIQALKKTVRMGEAAIREKNTEKPTRKTKKKIVKTRKRSPVDKGPTVPKSPSGRQVPRSDPSDGQMAS